MRSSSTTLPFGKNESLEERKSRLPLQSFFGSDGNIKAVGLPSRTRHIVIGGERSLYQAYKIDCHGYISHLSTTGYNSNHPEADTGVFYSLYSYLGQHGSSNIPQIIIVDCPETDCVTILLYKNTKIRQLLTRNSVKLFCKLHDQLIDQTGKKAKEPKKRVSIEEQSVRSEGYYVDFESLCIAIEADEAFSHMRWPAENHGLLSILTGNDKSPSFRSCTKTMAFKQFREECMARNIHTSFSGAPRGAFQQPVYNKCKFRWLRVLARPLQAVHNVFLSETLSCALR